MKTARVDLHLEPELLRAIDEARGDVARQRWITRAIEERLQAEGYEIHLVRQAQVVPIRPGIKATKPRRKTEPKPDQKRQRPRPSGTWRDQRR